MGQERKRLRRWLALFFIALTIPTGVLIRQAYSQLKWEAFHQHQVLAEELASRIDGRFIEMINTEEARSFTDYTFLVLAGAPEANFLQRSPLSAYPVNSKFPGLVGHFQVDAAGTFTTPLLPSTQTRTTAYGISNRERAERLALQNRVQRILSRNRLLRSVETKDIAPGKSVLKMRQSASPSIDDLSERDATIAAADTSQGVVASAEKQIAAQAAFDRLEATSGLREKKKHEAVSSLGRIEDLKLDAPVQSLIDSKSQRRRNVRKGVLLSKRAARKEISALPAPRAPAFQALAEAEAPLAATLRISTFESELDPFEFSLLDSGHFVLFRKVWRQGQRYIQGALIERRALLQGVIEKAFRETVLSQMSNLGVAYRGDVFSAFSGEAQRRYLTSTAELGGDLLYRTRLSAPLADLELIFTITQLPAGPGAGLITWIAVILALVLCGGFYLMYRLGARQIAIAQQQQDFVSAVSHELKTPLTSIRMYGEILREGWASDEKKKTYYDYIFAESERLSRLIANVLQLASMTRNELQVTLTPTSLSELMDEVRSKVASQIERAGFELRCELSDDIAPIVILIDADAFSQIVINLVDNAIKFSAQADAKIIEIAWQRRRDGTLQFCVRDYGPGVPRDQMKKIFRLFYRSENELTRETVGTGIGLALVQQLATAMGGKVDVVNKQPGAEFSVFFNPK